MECNFLCLAIGTAQDIVWNISWHLVLVVVPVLFGIITGLQALTAGY